MEIHINRGTQGTAILGLGEIPGRKRKALYRMHGCQIVPIAYINDEQDAQWIEELLCELAMRANGTIPRDAVANYERSINR